RPPCPTLFPYTTLFRSARPRIFRRQCQRVAIWIEKEIMHVPIRTISVFGPRVLEKYWLFYCAIMKFCLILTLGVFALDAASFERSEEHTSELQSRRDLV